MFNKARHNLDTFSGRLNALLDLAGSYSEPKEGRRQEFADEFGLKRSSAGNYLYRDLIPKRSILEGIVEDLLVKINGQHSVQEICAWLTYNVHNPFTGDDKVSEKLVIKIHGAIQIVGSLMGEPDVLDRLNVDTIATISQNVHSKFSANGTIDIHSPEVTRYISSQIKAYLSNDSALPLENT